MKSSLLATLSAVALLTACVSVNATMLRPGSYPPTVPEDIEIFLSEDDVEGEYEKIALLFAEGDADLTDRSELLEAMRKKAAQLGCHAIVIGDFEEPSTGERIAGVLLDTQVERRTQALGIRFIN